MTPPLIFRAFLGLLMVLAPTAALASFVVAGMKLRSEGGANYQAGGGFLKWIFLGALFLTLPNVSSWLVQEHVPSANLLVSGGPSRPYTDKIATVADDFVNDFLVGHIVPVAAAALFFKALLDQSQGTSPMGSIVAAMFLLGIQGIYKLATGTWHTSSTGAFGTTDLLMSAFNYAIGTLCPIIGGLVVCAGVLSFVQHKPWKGFVATGLAFVTASGLWALIQDWTGVKL